MDYLILRYLILQSVEGRVKHDTCTIKNEKVGPNLSFLSSEWKE